MLEYFQTMRLRRPLWQFLHWMFLLALAAKAAWAAEEQPLVVAIRKDLYHQNQKKMVWALRPRGDHLAGTP